MVQSAATSESDIVKNVFYDSAWNANESHFIMLEMQ